MENFDRIHNIQDNAVRKFIRATRLSDFKCRRTVEAPCYQTDRHMSNF
jgi:hypothetical protein